MQSPKAEKEKGFNIVSKSIKSAYIILAAEEVPHFSEVERTHSQKGAK